MSSLSPDQKHRFVVLDGMRGIAAIMVMIYHSSLHAPMGFLAVDLFFLLSGFVLAHGFGEKLSGSDGSLPETRLRFAMGRLIRIYPFYALGTAIALVPAIVFSMVEVYFWTPKVFVLSVLAAPFLIPLSYDWVFPLNPAAWSLTFELIANAAFLFLSWRKPPAIILVACSAPLLLWGIVLFPDGVGPSWPSLLGGFPRAFFSFFLGVLMCRLWRSGRLPKFGVHPLLLLILVAALYWVQPHHQTRYVAIMVFIVQPIIIWVGACSTAKGWTSRLMVWLGMISYGVYCLHLPILFWVDGVQRYANPALWNAGDVLPLSVYIVVPLTILAAHWLTLHFEIPTRRRLTARLNRWIANRAVARVAS